MRAAAGDRLPMFRQEERHRLVGSLDFLGFNHYSSWYVTEDYSDLAGAKLAGDWFVDQRTVARQVPSNFLTHFLLANLIFTGG